MDSGEWAQRQLCPDDGCVGVIGPDGTCKVCGRAAQNWGNERMRGLNPEPVEDEDDDDDEDDDEDDADDEDGHDLAQNADELDDQAPEDDVGDDEDLGDEPDERGAARGEWSGRALCTDGDCIGVIGADGRCKVCGKAAA
jgi:hypothetical protein